MTHHKWFFWTQAGESPQWHSIWIYQVKNPCICCMEQMQLEAGFSSSTIIFKTQIWSFQCSNIQLMLICEDLVFISVIYLVRGSECFNISETQARSWAVFLTRSSTAYVSWEICSGGPWGLQSHAWFTVLVSKVYIWKWILWGGWG